MLVCLSVRLLPLSRPSAFLILLTSVGKIISHGVGEAEVLCMDFCLSSCICVNLFADSSLTLNFVTVHLSRCKRVETVIPEGCYLFGVFFLQSQQGLFVVLPETIV